MAKLLLSDFLTYRFRYYIGYALIIISFIALLAVAGLYIPGGFSEGETEQFVQTASLDLQNTESLAIPNMPFFAAQRFIVDLLGPSTFAFKLPSLICAVIAGIGAVLLLRRWFRANIAVLATVIMITTGQFIYVAQSGTGGIAYILWSVWLLLIATMITTSQRHKRFWKVLFFIALPLSLYTPMSIYLVLAIVSAGLLHPHVRHVIKKMSRPRLAILSTISLIIAAPLGYLIALQPQLGLQLLGVPSTWPPDLWHNLQTLFQQYFNFMHPQSGTLITPLLGLGSMALIAVGFWQLWTIRYTARSYTLTAWIILLIPILIINPMFTSITFVPLLLVLASGLSYLLRSWYGIFPRNPYARFVGMIPLSILVAGLVLTGLGRYFDGYRYDPETANSFSRDLTLYHDEILGKDIKHIVVTPQEQPFYLAISHYIPESNIVVSIKAPTNSQFATTKAAHGKIDTLPARIVTTAYSHDSDRFYIYK